MNLDRKFLVWAMGYAVAGMGIGLFMAASRNHVQHVSHAHVLLVGFVVSFVYGVIHRLWLNGRLSAFAKAQFIVHQAGALTMFAGLLLLYGGAVPAPQIDPILAVASITVLMGALMMFYMVLKANAAQASDARGTLPGEPMLKG